MPEEMSGEVPEPEELAEGRHITVSARNPDGWDLEINFSPDWMSPYEVYGMLREATRNMKRELAATNAAEDPSES